MTHDWKPGEHFWGPWLNLTGLPRPTQYRTCVHPKCNETEKRVTPGFTSGE